MLNDNNKEINKVDNENGKDEKVQEEAKNVLRENEGLKVDKKKNKMDGEEKGKRGFSKRSFRSGAYATVISVIVIAVAILLNLFVGELDLSLDLTPENRYTLTEDSNNLLKGLKDNVTIYYLVQEGSQEKIIEKIVNQYGSFQNINVVVKDPKLYPTFAMQYTEAEVQQNDVIVVNENTNMSRYIPIGDMIVENTDYSSYTQYYTLDAEGQITAAIQYVMNENAVKMYVVTGHKEVAAGAEFTKTLQKAGITTEELNTTMSDAIPEDCNILFINGPAYDLSDHELEMIMKYLEEGGKAVLTTQYTVEELKNYKTLLNHYGVDVVDGMVFEGKEGNYFPPYVFYLRPELTGEHDIVSGLDANKFLMIPYSKGFHKVENHRGSMTVEPLMTTSEAAYSKINFEGETVEKQAEDINGPFYLGMAVTDTFKDYETKVVIMGGANMFEDSFFTSGQYVNGDVFLNSVQWMTGSQNSTIVVPSRSLEETYIVVPPAQRVIIGVIAIAFLPIGLLLIGFIIWIVRRRS